MANYLIKNAILVNEQTSLAADVFIKNNRIEKMGSSLSISENHTELVAEGLHLLPGLIDDQVHFREPGLTHKADIHSESIAAVAGGVTSFMEMPNVIPPSLSMELLEKKYAIAAACSPANYSFYMGVSNDNASDALLVNQHKNDICGLKIFMGSSTGNMLVDNIVTLEKIFSESEVLIATHCEKEDIVRQNKEAFIQSHGQAPNHARLHPVIRNTEACYESSLAAIQLAMKHNTRLHILHITTAKEIELFSNMLPLAEKRITAEACVHHLWFCDEDYERLGNLIKCNPAIKTAHDRDTVFQAVLDNRIDVIATDHAPHTWEEKQLPYADAPAGLPLIQHSLLMMLEHYHNGRISLEKIVQKTAHDVAVCFHIKERGYIREGYFADLVLVDINSTTTVNKENILYKCQWSPLDGHTFHSKICSTFVNGTLVYDGSKVLDTNAGMRMQFSRK